jgi:hypothetical protein
MKLTVLCVAALCVVAQSAEVLTKAVPPFGSSVGGTITTLVGTGFEPAAGKVYSCSFSLGTEGVQSPLVAATSATSIKCDVPIWPSYGAIAEVALLKEGVQVGGKPLEVKHNLEVIPLCQLVLACKPLCISADLLVTRLYFSTV